LGWGPQICSITTRKEFNMCNTKIAYTEEQIRYIKQVLIKSDETIKFLQNNLTENNIEVPRCSSEDEIATCLRILETKSQYV
jgi:hypothetical protein